MRVKPKRKQLLFLVSEERACIEIDFVVEETVSKSSSTLVMCLVELIG